LRKKEREEDTIAQRSSPEPQPADVEEGLGRSERSNIVVFVVGKTG
jgi:hypothetical protein